MPILVGDILKAASITLLDESFVRWTKAELIEWVNEGAADLVIRRPAARAIHRTFELTEGTYQVLPDDTVMLLDVVRNVKADGKFGVPVRRIDRNLLDDQSPGWHGAKSSITIKHFMFDEATPRQFYVWPPAKGGTLVDLLHSQMPPVVVDEVDELEFGREYLSVMVYYLCYRAFSKDSEYANAGMATNFFAAYKEAIDTANGITEAASPNVRSA